MQTANSILEISGITGGDRKVQRGQLGDKKGREK